MGKRTRGNTPRLDITALEADLRFHQAKADKFSQKGNTTTLHHDEVRRLTALLSTTEGQQDRPDSGQEVDNG